jgi:hypothetical protein
MLLKLLIFSVFILMLTIFIRTVSAFSVVKSAVILLLLLLVMRDRKLTMCIEQHSSLQADSLSATQQIPIFYASVIFPDHVYSTCGRLVMKS